MKVSSCSNSVAPPNTAMIARLAHSIGSTRLPRSLSQPTCTKVAAIATAGRRVDVGDLEGDEEEDDREEVEQELHLDGPSLPALRDTHFHPPTALRAASFAGRTTRPLAETLTVYSAPSDIGTYTALP